jgi:hypothetical protein
MSKLAELFKQGKYDEMWDICCGFIDLSLEDFMSIQRRLLMEQLELLKKCQLGKELLKGKSPKSLDEFRKMIPLTNYDDDYSHCLLKRRMDMLPKKPILWQYTSGKSGSYSYRWAPVTARQLDEIEPMVFAMLFFASCNGRKDVPLKELDSFLYGMAPPPYATGTVCRVLPHEIFNFLPPVNEAETMSFEDRVKKGFKMALNDGMDICFAMSSIAVAMGNRLSESNGKTNYMDLVKKPKSLARLVKGKIKSKIAGRKMLPKDLWDLKALISFGIDGSIFRDKIKEMWGRYPLDIHGCTEAPVIAMQTWDYEGMTFVPHLNLFEFIPEEEAVKTWQDPNYQPKTYLMDEVKPGNYELVITSFMGGPFVRFRLGHLVKITSLRNEELNIDIPQMQFLSRVDDQLDVAGFTRLTEKVIWQAIENANLSYNGWTVRKETEQDKPVMRLYIEMKDDNNNDAYQISDTVHQELKKLDKPYTELESFIGLNPLRVTLLHKDAFKLYKAKQKADGAELTHLTPPHLNPSPDIIEFLTGPLVRTAPLGRERVSA